MDPFKTPLQHCDQYHRVLPENKKGGHAEGPLNPSWDQQCFKQVISPRSCICSEEHRPEKIRISCNLSRGK